MPDGRHDHALQVEKLVGGDFELGNFVLGLESSAGDTCREASRALLAQIPGLPLESRRHAMQCRCWDCRSGDGSPVIAWQGVDGTWNLSWSGALGEAGGAETPGPGQGVLFDPQDTGRRFLPGNGSSCYIDLSHLEITLPEVLSARDHVAAWRAMLQVARSAQVAANQGLPHGQEVHVLVNNSDGQGHSYGGHLNFLVTRRAWDNLFLRKPHHLGFLASFQVSSIVYAGQGKVGSENGQPDVDFQLGQRADFFEALAHERTTFRRPVVNSRDEALCGRAGTLGEARPADSLARLHVIFYDANLCQAAHFLKVGAMQIVLAMIEAERVRADLLLDDPVKAVVRWSHDPDLVATARDTSGRRLRAVELQELLLGEARRFADEGGLNGLVPEHELILDLWEDTLARLAARDFDALAARLDWVLKRRILLGAMERRGLDWGSPEVKHLDQVYGSLDPERGLFWAYETAGQVERLVDGETVERFVQEPPEDTRAWTRAMLLRRAAPDQVEDVDWDRVRFRVDGRTRTVYLEDPRRFTREEMGELFAGERPLEEILDALGAEEGVAGDRRAAGQAGAPSPRFA